ncbi:MAG: cyclic nucleotide-binding domain-containing protein [Acidobacteriota bacterium]
MARSVFADFTARYKANEIVFAKGDPGSTLFVVQSGSLELTVPGAEGETDEVLGVMEKGDFFGEMSLLEGSPRTFTARTLEPVVAIEIGPALFDRMIRSNIELAVRMLRKLSIRLGEAESRLAARTRSQATSVPPAASPRPATPSSRVSPKKKKIKSEPAPSPAGAVLTDAAPAFLVNPEGKDVFPLQEQTARIGRFDPVTGTKPEVDLTLLDLKRSVSRRHAILICDSDKHLLDEEVGALNGTLVNGQAVHPGQPIPVQDGDHLSFGGVELVYRTSRPGTSDRSSD